MNSSLVFRTRLVAFACFLVCTLAAGASSAGAATEADIVDPPATSRGDPAYANELVARARDLHLADDVHWLRLGHYAKGLFGGQHGEADGPLFWLAPDGKSDPAAELEATLRGIWAPESPDPHAQHPFCRFPARLAWLDGELHFDAGRLPQRTCARYAHFVKRLHAGSAALVFSAYFMNNPISAFGHTFLRIHKAGAARGSELLDTGVDFSAETDTSNALLYAFKGMTGMFPGVFHTLPYYYKVREYNDYESRDLWEYELNLSERALAMLVAHLWEEGSTWFDYYYLSENCSYHVLAALQAAEPSLHLLGTLKYPVLPADTVAALFTNPGLVRQVKYRPSMRATVRHELGALTPAQRDAVGALIGNPDAPFPPSMTPRDQAGALDAATDLVDVREAHEVLLGHDEVLDRLKQRLLERRADIPVSSVLPPPPVPLDKMPHVGHATSRLAMGTGYSPDLGGGFYQLEHRIALHDLTDAPDGYPETSEIQFMPFRLRYYPKEKSLRLEELSILKLLSMTPWRSFQHPLSWGISGGVTRIRDDGCLDCTAGTAEGAAGLTLSLDRADAFAFYAMADLGLEFAPRLHGLGDSDWRPRVGPMGGLRWRLAHTLVWTADGRWSYLPGATPNETWMVETKARWSLARNVAVGAELRRQPIETDGVFSAFFYF